MTRFISTLVVLCFIGSQSLIANSKDKLFYDAVRAEASGDLLTAIDLYEGASKVSKSSNLHGNLANLYFKTEKYGKAVLNYRRALLLDPGNRAFQENLNFALETAGVNFPKTDLSIYLNSSSIDFWIISLTSSFWVGALALAFLYFQGWNQKKFIFPILIWFLLLCFLFWGAYTSTGNKSLLTREVIVTEINENESNASQNIPLRRFAGSGSSANTYVKPGESLWLNLSSNSLLQSHKSLSGQKWFLVQSIDNSKKGWVKSDAVSFLTRSE